MGPLIFNIVINDLSSATKNFDFVMYADDTTPVSTLQTFGRTCNVKEIERNINMEISKVTTWLQRNKLQLNVSKSKFMMFFKHLKTLPKLNITANGNLIDQVSEFNFLVITIDENITWNPHIRNTSIKIARVIGIRVGVKYSTCTWYLYLSTYLSVLDVLEYLVYGNAKVLLLVLDQKVLGTYK